MSYGSVSVVWPRGISSSLNVIAPSGASKTLERRPSKAKSLLRTQKWETRVVSCLEDNPERAVIQSQEKLRQHSVRQFGNGNGGNIEVGQGPIPTLNGSDSFRKVSE